MISAPAFPAAAAVVCGDCLLVPVLVWAISSDQLRIAFGLFLAAGLSDAVDGFLAKRFGMATALVAWFAGVSIFFTVKPIRDRFIASGKWFNRITGAALVGFGFRLALARAAD